MDDGELRVIPAVQLLGEAVDRRDDPLDHVVAPGGDIGLDVRGVLLRDPAPAHPGALPDADSRALAGIGPVCRTARHPRG